jgi:hypothetical protein
MVLLLRVGHVLAAQSPPCRCSRSMKAALVNPDLVLAAKPPTAGARSIPSVTSVALAVPLVLLYWQFGTPSALLTDPNTGVHVRTGEWILTHHAIPRREVFSFAICGRAWCDWEWLSDVLYALLHRWHGLAAVAAFSLAGLCLTSAVIYLTALLHTSSAPAFTLACLVIATTTIHWLARPHLFTWLLVAVFCWVIERARVAGSRRPLLALPLLTLVWVNLHPGFIAGLLILGVGCAAEALQARLGSSAEERAAHKRWAQWFAFTGVACFAVTFANPYGIHLHRHILSYLFSLNTVTPQVAEWLPPDFGNPRLHWFELMLPLGAAAGLWHGLRGRFAWCALTLGWMHLALGSVRNVPLFAIVCAAPVASLFEYLVRQWSFGRQLHAAEASLERSQFATAVCCGIAGILLAVFHTRSLRLGPNSSLPIEAIPHVPPGRLFTTDRWADYVIYAEPGRQVFFDCRNDLYGPQFVNAYQTVMTAVPGWQEVLQRYGLTVALVPAESPISAALEASAAWRQSYSDTTAAVFVSEKQHP